MARLQTKTIYTPEPPGHKHVTFPVASLEEVGRNKNGGWAKFHATLSKANPLGALGEEMDWENPGEKEKLVNLDGSLDASNMSLEPREVSLQGHSCSVPISKVLGFQIVRRELKGKKKKGFRWELRFEVSFSSEDALSLLDNYFIRTSPAPASTVVVTYTEPAEQIEIPEVQATEEQRQAALELRTN